MALLCAKGQGNEWHVRWHMTMPRALAAYHAIMAMQGIAMDFAAARHSRSEREAAFMRRRVECYHRLTRQR